MISANKPRVIIGKRNEFLANHPAVMEVTRYYENDHLGDLAQLDRDNETAPVRGQLNILLGEDFPNVPDIEKLHENFKTFLVKKDKEGTFTEVWGTETMIVFPDTFCYHLI